MIGICMHIRRITPIEITFFLLILTYDSCVISFSLLSLKILCKSEISAQKNFIFLTMLFKFLFLILKSMLNNKFSVYVGTSDYDNFQLVRITIWLEIIEKL